MGGRKAVKQAALDCGCVEPQQGQSIMRVVALRGSNLVEVEDGTLDRTLCMMPAKFSKSLWIKRGNYVLVDEGDRQKVLDANSKVTGTIARVLYKEQVRALQKTQYWPAGFETEEKLPSREEGVNSESKTQKNGSLVAESENEDEDEDSDLPALEQNTNRHMGRGMYSPSSESDEDSETE